MTLVDLLSEEVIRIPLGSSTKYDIMEELIQILKAAGKVNDYEKAYDAIFDREAKGSTGLENGIAVPHAKTDAVESITLSLGISPVGVDFEAIDGKPSHLFFLLLAPFDQSGPHIEVLSEIARITRSQSFCRAIVSSDSPKAVLDLFRAE